MRETRHRRDLELNGDHPTRLTRYGGFGDASTPHFSPPSAARVELGGVYAEANLRAGGEFGEEWHRAGMLANKQNVFDDSIAAGEAPILLRHYMMTGPSGSQPLSEQIAEEVDVLAFLRWRVGRE